MSRWKTPCFSLWEKWSIESRVGGVKFRVEIHSQVGLMDAKILREEDCNVNT